MQRGWRGNACCLGRFVPESQCSAAAKCPTRKGKFCWAGAEEREAFVSSHQPQRALLSFRFVAPLAADRALNQ